MKAKKLKKEVDKTIKYLCKKVRDDNYMQCITTNVHSAVLAWIQVNTVTVRKRDSDR